MWKYHRLCAQQRRARCVLRRADAGDHPRHYGRGIGKARACHRGRGQQGDCARRRCGTPHAARALHRMDRAGDGSGQPAQAFGAGPEAGSRVYAGRGRQRCGRVRVLQPAQPVEGLKKLPFAARGSFRTPRHPKNVSRTGR